MAAQVGIMKRTTKKLSLDTTTLRTLDRRDLASVGGGSSYLSAVCAPPPPVSIKVTAGTLFVCSYSIGY
jgi:hypothetical protein